MIEQTILQTLSHFIVVLLISISIGLINIPPETGVRGICSVNGSCNLFFELKPLLDPAGAVWHPNRLIDVDWPTMRIRGEMLIESVALDYDIENGDTGSVAIVHPGAYDPLKIPGSSGKQKPSGGAKTVAGFVKKVGNNWIERWSGDRPL